jgi:hypothetical protein
MSEALSLLRQMDNPALVTMVADGERTLIAAPFAGTCVTGSGRNDL